MIGSGWAVTALALYLAGLVLAFGVRTWVQIRRTGTSGFRGISGRPGSPAWWGGVLFPIALLAGVAAPVLVLAGGGTAVLPASPLVAGVGLLLAAAGLVVVLIAQATMGASWRIGVEESERTELVTRGLFGRIRNPIFTGMAGVCAGLVLMVPTPVALLALVCLVAAVQIQVRVVEEPYLRRVHGEAYLRYLARAGRFLPGLGRRPAGPPSQGRHVPG